MPRPSYEVHRAKRIASERRSSIIESETDAESLASYTTWNSGLSSTSYLSGSAFSQHGHHNQPSPRRSAFSPSSLSREATASASASGSTSNLHSNSSAYPRQVVNRSTRASPAPSSSTLGIPEYVGAADKNLSAKRRLDAGERAERRRRREERRMQSTLLGERYDSPLRRWLRWMSKQGLSKVSLPCGLVGVGLVKIAVGFGDFSGKDTPPMYGDFEAQRHWMEVTLHRPMEEWYTYSPDWWLLDYPPLTAYASWLCGKIGSSLFPDGFALDTSWGSSPPTLVTYMRLSVLAFEGLIWWSAVVAWVVLQSRKESRSWRSQVTGILTILLQPSLTLIDNGHFQYNSVLLGLSLWSLVLLLQDQDLLACVTFSLALCFKQMGLYYAPAIGCYLFGKCLWLGGSTGLMHFAKLGTVTASTFLFLFFPWLQPFPDAILHVLHRIFPFARGIFEDKVANLWCASNVVIKWRKWFSIPGMARLATVATLASLMPIVILILYTSISTRPLEQDKPAPSNVESSATRTSATTPPTARLLPMTMFTASMSFFLFSFQVHEKSILLPLMPLTVAMAFRGGKDSVQAEDELWDVGALINNVAVFSMWPLLTRDGQSLQYVFMTFLWNYTIGYSPAAVQSPWLRRGGYLIYAAIAILHLPDVFSSQLPPPARYPDLYVVLNVLLSFGVFGMAWLWSIKKLLESAWAIGGIDHGRRDYEGKAVN